MNKLLLFAMCLLVIGTTYAQNRVNIPPQLRNIVYKMDRDQLEVINSESFDAP